MIFLLSKCLKWKLFTVQFWLTFILTIFPKGLAKKSSSTFDLEIIFLTFVVCFDEMAPRRRSSSPKDKLVDQNKTNFNEIVKVVEHFSASFLRKMVKIKCDHHKTMNKFDFIHFFSNESPSYPTVECGMLLGHSNSQNHHALPWA